MSSRVQPMRPACGSSVPLSRASATPRLLTAFRDFRCHASIEVITAAWVGNDRDPASPRPDHGGKPIRPRRARRWQPGVLGRRCRCLRTPVQFRVARLGGDRRLRPSSSAPKYAASAKSSASTPSTVPMRALWSCSSPNQRPPPPLPRCNRPRQAQVPVSSAAPWGSTPVLSPCAPSYAAQES